MKLEAQYLKILAKLGEEESTLGVVFKKAQNKIQDPAKLRRLVFDLIGAEQWMSLSVDVKGDAYVWSSKTGHRWMTCGLPAVVGARLAASQACDPTHALLDVRPPDRLDGAAVMFFGLEGRRVAGAAPGGRGAAAPEP
jgi:hypothetical protein